MTDDRLVVGLVRGVHGLRGLLRVEILTDNETRFAVGNVLHAEASSDPLTVVTAQPDGPGLLVRFAEISSRGAADRLRNVYLEAAAVAPPDEQSFYWHDIIGCATATTQGEDLGRVIDVFRVGEGEVYVVDGPRGELLVPAVTAVVRELNPAAKRMVIDGAALGLDEVAE